MTDNQRQKLKQRVVASFEASFGVSPELLVAAPGRANLIGEHCDYNDCHVLPAAINYGTIVAIGASTGPDICAVACDYSDGRDQFDPAAPFAHQQDEWKNHVRGVAASLHQRGYAPGGVAMAIGGNVPQGAGLSSSASVNVAMARALTEYHGITDISSTDIAQIAKQSENDFVGTACGIMDQLASAKGKEGCGLLIDCRTLKTQDIALPKDWAVLVIHSGIQRELVSSAFNDRRAECEAAAVHYGMPALRDASEEQLNSARGGLDDRVFRRARHVVTENARVLEAVDAIARADMKTMAALMTASHASLRDDFEVSLPAIDRLVEMVAMELGADGGIRLTGAGFGGCVIALMHEDRVDDIGEFVAANYRGPDGSAAQMFRCHISNGAAIL